MSLTLTCTCGRQEQVPDTALGTRVKCPSCGRLVFIRRPQGNRRRMYIFERAYTDFAAIFLAVFRYFRKLPDRLWRWFWNGPGATVMEWVLRGAVVVSGVLFAVLYARYETVHGRGFGIEMLFAFAIIAGYVALLMWGWKAPVHVGARAASGAAAGVAISIAGAAILAGGAVAFTAYLAALITLTALTVVVFAPLRLYLLAYMKYRKLTYDCPCDMCTRRGTQLPAYQCKCGHVYRNLQPSFYGLFYHRCYHPDGTVVKLPTLDFLGRHNLPQFCPSSGQPMVYGKHGLMRRFPVMLVGATSSGKTVLCTQIVRDLTARIGAADGNEASMEPQDRLGEMLRLLDSGQLPDKTVGDRMSSVGIVVRKKDARRKRLLIELFDEPGEVYESMEHFAEKQVMQRAGAIILLIDPHSLPRFPALARRAEPADREARARMERTVRNLVQVVAMLRDPGPDGKFDIPLAVAISKADELPTAETWLANLCPQNGHVVDEAMLSARCRNALVNLGIANEVLSLEQQFSNIRFFALSALGRRPDGRTTPFKPVAVSRPFLWMLRDDRMLAGVIGARPTQQA